MGWDEIYQRGEQLNIFPYDHVVSFLARAGGRSALEVGCGAGNNLAAAARFGYQIAGIDQSPTAIGVARSRLPDADLRVGDMRELPWPGNAFDVVIDRAAVGCLLDSHSALTEIHRVLKQGGWFLFNPFASEHPRAATNTIAGSELPQHYYTHSEIAAALRDFTVAETRHVVITDESGSVVHAEWRITARKSDPPTQQMGQGGSR